MLLSLEHSLSKAPAIMDCLLCNEPGVFSAVNHLVVVLLLLTAALQHQSPVCSEVLNFTPHMSDLRRMCARADWFDVVEAAHRLAIDLQPWKGAEDLQPEASITA